MHQNISQKHQDIKYQYFDVRVKVDKLRFKA